MSGLLVDPQQPASGPDSLTYAHYYVHVLSYENFYEDCPLFYEGLFQSYVSCALFYEG